MVKLSTREAAKRLKISYETLAHYIANGKVPAPEILPVGRRVVHMWTEKEVEDVRGLLPKIANGRKTRYQKLREKKEGAQPKAAALRQPKKKKK